MATTAAAVGQVAFQVSGFARSSHLTQGAAACPSNRALPHVHGSRPKPHAARSVTVRAAENESEAPQEEVRRLGQGRPPAPDRKWGYTEFDSAGQKNIYAVEPTIYVANNGLSSGKKGTEGQGNSTLILLGIGAAVAVGAFASLNLLGNTAVPAKNGAIRATAGLDTPPLSFYIEKFSRKESTLETASVPAPEVQSEATPEFASTSE